MFRRVGGGVEEQPFATAELANSPFAGIERLGPDPITQSF